MSRRTVVVIFAVAVVLVVAGAVLQLAGSGTTQRVGQVAVILAALCSIVGVIGNSFRAAREDKPGR